MKMTLYSVASSSACERVRIALALKGVSYDIITISAMPPGDYLKINPQGLMPALKIGETILTQSMAMLEYLEETYPEPSLFPADPVRRAQVRAFAQIIASDIHPVGIGRLRKNLRKSFGASEQQTLEWYDDVAQSGFAMLEGLLTKSKGEGPYCFGQDVTLADIVMVPHMHTAHERGVDFSSFPLAASVFKACTVHPAFVAAAR